MRTRPAFFKVEVRDLDNEATYMMYIVDFSAKNAQQRVIAILEEDHIISPATSIKSTSEQMGPDSVSRYSVWAPREDGGKSGCQVYAGSLDEALSIGRLSFKAIGHHVSRTDLWVDDIYPAVIRW